MRIYVFLLALVGRFDDRMGRIPPVLRFSMYSSFLLGVSLPISTLYGGLNINGVAMSPRELWNNGIAWAMLVSSPLMLGEAVGIFLRKRWARLMLLAMPFLQYLPYQAVYWLLGSSEPMPSLRFFYLISGVLWVTGFLMYFRWSKSARSYFQSVDGTEPI